MCPTHAGWVPSRDLFPVLMFPRTPGQLCGIVALRLGREGREGRPSDRGIIPGRAPRLVRRMPGVASTKVFWVACRAMLGTMLTPMPTVETAGDVLPEGRV